MHTHKDADPAKMLALVADLNAQKFIPNPMFPVLGPNARAPTRPPARPSMIVSNACFGGSGYARCQRYFVRVLLRAGIF